MGAVKVEFASEFLPARAFRFVVICRRKYRIHATPAASGLRP